MSLALDPSLLALAVVATAVGALHDAGSATSMATMAVTMAMLARLSHAAAGLIHEHNKEDGNGSQGAGGAHDLGGRHDDLVDLVVVGWSGGLSRMMLLDCT